MSPLIIAIIGIICLFVLIFLGMPIGAAIGFIGFMGLSTILNFGAGIVKLGQTAFGSVASYLMAVIPLFILMGEFTFASGLISDAYNTMNKLFGQLRGGLAIATVGACAVFSAACGSSSATASTIAGVALPEMKKYNYEPGFALGTIAAGGTLGILIPPSTALVLYGLITEQSIGQLLLAGILPGILLSFLFMVSIYIQAKLNPDLVSQHGYRSTWKEKFSALRGVLGVAIIFLLVMGGIYTGIFTPTEAAAVGVIGSFIIAAIKKRMSKTVFINSFLQMFRTTGMIFVLVIGSTIFSYFIVASGLTIALGDLIGNLAVTPLVILLSILLLFLILGCVMDAFSMMLIMIPILFPLVVGLGYDPIWFGIITVVTVEMGLITPPIGMNVFIISGVARDVPLYKIFRGVLPFVLVMVLCLGILIIFPNIALYLPKLMK